MKKRFVRIRLPIRLLQQPSNLAYRLRRRPSFACARNWNALCWWSVALLRSSVWFAQEGGTARGGRKRWPLRANSRLSTISRPANLGLVKRMADLLKHPFKDGQVSGCAIGKGNPEPQRASGHMSEFLKRKHQTASVALSPKLRSDK